jgi:hypothetical protein
MKMKQKQPAPPDILRKGGAMKDRKKESKKNPKRDPDRLPDALMKYLTF